MFILSHPPRSFDPRGHSFDRAAKRSNNLTCPRAQQHHRAAARASLPLPTMPINNPVGYGPTGAPTVAGGGL